MNTNTSLECIFLQLVFIDAQLMRHAGHNGTQGAEHLIRPVNIGQTLAVVIVVVVDHAAVRASAFDGVADEAAAAE